jgi:hypothetical protein
VEESLAAGAGRATVLTDFDYVIRPVREEACRDEPCPYHQRCRRAVKFVRQAEASFTFLLFFY